MTIAPISEALEMGNKPQDPPLRCISPESWVVAVIPV